VLCGLGMLEKHFRRGFVVQTAVFEGRFAYWGKGKVQLVVGAESNLAARPLTLGCGGIQTECAAIVLYWMAQLGIQKFNTIVKYYLKLLTIGDPEFFQIYNLAQEIHDQEWAAAFVFAFKVCSFVGMQ
jgi:hypothetical protein